jgi:cytidylate kinase
MAYRSFLDVGPGTVAYLRAAAIDRHSAAHDIAAPHTGPAFSIALSREAGIDADAVAREVGRRLGWQVWDHELLVAIAERLHSRISDLAPVDETHVSWLKESLESFLELHAVSQIAYIHQLVQILIELGENGECVIVGRGAAQMLPAETTLRVHLIAPLKERVAAMSQRLGGGATNRVARKLEQIDRDRARFVKDYFHRDPADLSNFDLVLNMSRLSTDDCAELIVDALHAEQASRAEHVLERAVNQRSLPL